MIRTIATALALMTLFAAACHPGEKKAAGAQGETTRDTVSGALPPSAFLEAYDSLRDAFFRSDTAAADAAVRRLDGYASSLPLQGPGAKGKSYDSARLAITGLHAAAGRLLAGRTLHDKRVQFARISDLCWQLIPAAGISGKTVYLEFCPMFGDGSGAHWLSQTRTVANPYYGAQMPDCGQVADSVRL
jgi:hypothetical protein